MVAGAVCTFIGFVLTGTLLFTKQNDGKVHVTGQISGLTPGRHGFHIHQNGDLRQGCTSALGHFNPTNKSHGAPYDVNRHVGDLGNILADDSGEANVDITDNVISLCGGKGIIGRSVVVHSGEDDLGRGGNDESLKTGNAGSRLACCVIGRLQ